MNEALLVNEVYRTLEGEGLHAGLPCALVRLAGCNLRCRWCDTQYAYAEGRRLAVEDVLRQLAGMNVGLVLVTGGEPLLQPACGQLLSRLCQAGYKVLLQTNGSLDVWGVDRRVVRCLDVKCPGSGESDSFLWSNLEHLRQEDEVKFVLADRADYEFARRTVREHGLADRCHVVMTPAAGALSPLTLAEWMLQDADLPAGVRLGLQLHKIIWPQARRGV
jgi:7-carboxy-7-deazaguanine synthase